MRALLLLAAVAAGVYLLDQAAKYLVVTRMEIGEVISVLGPVLQLNSVRNSGAAFSLASGFTWILSIVALGVIVVIVLFARRIHSTAWAVMLGLLLGGALGNVTDRLFREPGFGVGHVVDFIQIWGFPAIFNLADVGIVSAMGLFLLLTLRGVGLDGRRHSDDEPAVATDASDGPGERPTNP
ncbi:signal peptidase II [Homoserinibacter sp. GY 40078]|nr:signal peptidase II [Homoserinibacter sp. GY 40078]